MDAPTNAHDFPRRCRPGCGARGPSRGSALPGADAIAGLPLPRPRPAPPQLAGRPLAPRSSIGCRRYPYGNASTT